ncbi:hypothetical protein [Paracoccus aminovorans]
MSAQQSWPGRSPDETGSPVTPCSTISANDVLNGGAGDDFLIGGSGADLLQFRSAHGVGIIADFSEEDRLIITQTSMARTSIRMRWVIGCRTWTSSCRRGWISFDDRPLKRQRPLSECHIAFARTGGPARSVSSCLGAGCERCTKHPGSEARNRRTPSSNCQGGFEV